MVKTTNVESAVCLHIEKDRISRHNFRIRNIKNTLNLLYPELKKELSECNVLDVGCGRGTLSFSIAKHVNYLKGIDVQKSNIDYANRLKKEFNIKNVDFEMKSIIMFSEKEKYDIVFMSDVIEHIEEQQKALDVVISCIRDDGVFYITTNNKMWPIEGHFSLLFLSYLPKSLANKYVGFFRNGKNYSDIFLLSYFKIKKLLRNEPVTYTFKSPTNPRKVVHRIGIKLVNVNELFWMFADVFQIIGKKRCSDGKNN